MERKEEKAISDRMDTIYREVCEEGVSGQEKEKMLAEYILLKECIRKHELDEERSNHILVLFAKLGKNVIQKINDNPLILVAVLLSGEALIAKLVKRR